VSCELEIPVRRRRQPGERGFTFIVLYVGVGARFQEELDKFSAGVGARVVQGQGTLNILVVYVDTMLEEGSKDGERADFRKSGQRGFALPYIGGFEIGASFKEVLYRIRFETPVGADDGDPFDTGSFVE
jgi:hypothetical protein